MAAMTARLRHTVLDSAYPPAVARFWSRALGWPIQHSDPDWAVVAPGPDAVGLAFQHSPEATRSTPVAALGAILRSPDRRRGTEGAVLEVGVSDRARAIDDLLRWGALPVDAGHADEAVVFSDPAGHHLRLVDDPEAPAPTTAPIRIHRRYLAIGDSITEGLNDSDPTSGQWRGFADRLAAQLVTSQRTLEPELEVRYANLAVSGYRLAEIHSEELQRGLELEPDLITVMGGFNDILELRPSFAAMAEHYDAMFGAAVASGATVLTFTAPDISRANPVATAIRDRISALNEIVRHAAGVHDVALVDFENVPSAGDPRIWSEDRLHLNALGHLRMAAALAWLLRLPGSNRDWALELDATITETPAAGLGSHLQWARHHFGPWIVAGIRGPQYRQGAECKRPEMTPVVLD